MSAEVDPRWRHLDMPRSSPITAFYNQLRKLSVESPHRLPSFEGAETLFVTSDYSGDHTDAPYQVLSFLVTDPRKCGDWMAAQAGIRRALLRDGRRMSYKQLRDRVRVRALPTWLSAADLIPGICFTIAIQRGYGSLFDAPAPLDFSHPAFAPYASWPHATLEKACRLCHFIGVAVAAMASPGQDVYWFGDRDEICANAKRTRELTDLFAWTCSHYLTVGLRHLRVGNTLSDDGSRLLEDLASLPDLAAGAVAEILNRKTAEGIRLSTEIVWPVAEISDKASAILLWLGEGGHRLSRIACEIESTGPSTSVTSFLRFGAVTGP